MLYSDSKKESIFGFPIKPAQHSVRLPLQMLKNVRVLSTNVNFDKFKNQTFDNLAMLRDLGGDWPIYHLRIDRMHCRSWSSEYYKLRSAFQSINRSRILRRMRITGFRMMNVEASAGKSSNLLTDTYVLHLDNTCVLLDFAVRSFVPDPRPRVRFEIMGTLRTRKMLRAQVLGCDAWQCLPGIG